MLIEVDMLVATSKATVFISKKSGEGKSLLYVHYTAFVKPI